MRPLVLWSLVATMLIIPYRSFGADAMKLRYLGTIFADSKESPLKHPEGVACDDQGQVLIADTEKGRLVRYSLQDNVLKGGAEIKVPELLYPVRVQLDSKGNIFALDGKARKIAQLTPEGTFTRFVTPEGVNPPATIVPKSFKLDSRDNIFLLDIAGERVLQLDPQGKLIAQIPFPKDYSSISDLALTAGGDVLLLDSTKSTVYLAKKEAPQFAPFTKLGDYLNFATNIITTSRSADIYLVDQDGGAIVILGPDGKFKGRQLSLGWRNGQLYYPQQMCINKNGDVIIADRGNSRVQIFENLK